MAAGMSLSVSTDAKTLKEIAETFTKVTGNKAAHQDVPFEEYAKMAEPYLGAYVKWSFGPDAPCDDSVMTWSANFSASWNYWGEGKHTRGYRTSRSHSLRAYQEPRGVDEAKQVRRQAQACAEDE
ncbi:Putative NAD(P)-binding domain superfamily [Colletotrichum destructivum]|uniref:NAD(P)-binding domain superfamily n=1 Tax=Colletotrichum destructivum TaxID=34406 RepID=A0AAX4IXI6_9PEZI|nr:Putative NAD(P)-binding domain superfamily [Colletotrichum destructivum]